MEKILVSACLLGHKVRYNGLDALLDDKLMEQWLAEGRVITFCPEVAGGFPIPRPPAEITGYDRNAVLAGEQRVMDIRGCDVTAYFINGAKQALETAQMHRVKVAVLKEGSPSCGSNYIYDGSFSGKRKTGKGITATLLEQHGIRVFSEVEIEAAADYLEGLEKAALSTALH